MLDANPEGFYPQEMVEGLRQNAEAVLREAIARVKELEPSVVCEGRVREGRLTDILVMEAKDAAVVVVGSRGRGRLTGLVLGFIGQQVANQALRPVTIVREKVC